MTIGYPNEIGPSNDTITLGDGNNVVIGGAGADTIVVGATGQNVIIGDDGEADYTSGVLTKIFSTDGLVGIGGDDSISGPLSNGLPTYGGSGDNVVIGGIGADTIWLGGADNTIIGDDGEATFTAEQVSLTPTYVSVLNFIETTDQTVGGDDTINVIGGGNVIFGGSGADNITAGDVGSVIMGDNGEASFTVAPTTGTISAGDAAYGGTLTYIETTAEQANGTETADQTAGGTIYGGDDTITVGNGANVIVGGLGADTITTGTGNNIILGDSGKANFDSATGVLINIFSTYGSAPVGGAPTLQTPAGNPDLGTSSDDVITLGDGNNVVIGGAGSDQIYVGASGVNVIIGDDGEADYTSGVLTNIFSTDGTSGVGGDDTIGGKVNGVFTFGGSGDNVVIGGLGGDTIELGGNGNTIIGDDGYATFDATTREITKVSTQDPTYGGNDTITVSGGDNVIFGGTGGDAITVQTVSTTPSGNVIVGDDGYATFTTAGILTFITTADQTDGGEDVITTGDGNNVILGGSWADTISVGAGNNIILGDNGEAWFTTSGVLTTIDTIAEIAPTDGSTPSEQTDDPTQGGTIYGGDDLITVTGNGNNVIFGGLGADTITVNGNGNNEILGDSGYANFSITGVLQTIYSTYVGAPVGGTLPVGAVAKDLGTSSNDTIVLGTANGAGTGNNLVFGGSGADAITVYGNGNNIILGDDGEADFTDHVLTYLTSTDTNDGGDDTIIARGNGNDVVFGGLGADTIELGGGTNAVLGDSGVAEFSNSGVIETVYSIAPDAIVGGTIDTGSSSDDTITVGNGNDVVIGGSGDDQITAGNGNDYIIGDDGSVQYIVADGVNVVDSAQTTYGQYGGADTIKAGNGVDSIIGGDGNNVITAGNGNDDIILGSNGEIVQAFNANGDLELNSDGNPHRDVVLEEIGAITSSIAIDSAADAAAATAAAIADADLILLAGEFNADGSQVLSPSGAWETQALLLSLVPDGNNNITVGSGNDVIIGQGDNNTITAQGGNDIIFGNGASNTAPVSSDIPSIVNAVSIVGAPADLPIVIPVGGQLVVPTVNLLPSALTTNTPQLAMAPPGFGTLGNLAQGGTLALASGADLEVFASVVPSVLNGSPALPGSNVINGGSGNDTIFGNYGQIAALPTTGITQIDNQLQGLSVTMLGLLDELSALSTVQDAVDGGTPSTISLEDNSITVTGGGNDTIFGNVGEYLVPDVAFAQGSGSLASNAVALDTYLLEMQDVIADMSFVANEAGARIVGGYTGPADHLLDIGDNTINLTGNSGSDTVIGDVGIVVMPGDGTSVSDWAAGQSSATLQSVAQQLQSLESTFDANMSNEFAANFAFTPTDAAVASAGTGFDLSIGDNTIYGGSGNSTLIADTGLILDPVVGTGVDGNADASELQSIMVTAVDRLFLGAYSAPTADAESWGVTADLAASGATDWSSGGGFVFNDPSKSDITVDSSYISAGSGSDHIYGDLAVVLPELSSSPGLVTSFYAYPTGNSGQTSTSNYDYVYGFGPFGSLHQWASNPTSPSQYAVDGDTIVGGAGNNVIFGGIGDNTITGGSGDDQISAGNGFNTISGGGGINEIVLDRATDTYVAGGGDDISVSSLNTSAGSPLLAAGWQSVVGTELAAAMIAPTRLIVTLIQTDTGSDGSTSLVEVGNNYFLFAAGTSSGPELEYNGAPITSGEFGAWTPIGAVQISGGGYDVAWDIPGAKTYIGLDHQQQRQLPVEQRRSPGNGNQHRAGDDRDHFPAGPQQRWCDRPQDSTTVIETDGSTSLVEVGNNYFLYAAGRRRGPR